MGLHRSILGAVVRVDYLPGQQALRSAEANRLDEQPVELPFKLSTIGNSSLFPVLAFVIVRHQILHRHRRCRPFIKD